MSSRSASCRFFVAVDDVHEHGGTPQPQRAAALDPVGRVDERIGRVVGACSSSVTSVRIARASRAASMPRVPGGERPEPRPIGSAGDSPPPSRSSNSFFHVRLIARFITTGSVAAGPPIHLGRFAGECVLVAGDQILGHARRRHARKIGAARRHRQRQRESHDVVGGVADHRLIEVAQLDHGLPRLVPDRSEVADVAITADPGVGPRGNRVAGRRDQS